MKEVHGLLGAVIRGLIPPLLAMDISKEEGCALIQALDCLAHLVKQQRCGKPKADAAQPCFRWAVQLHLQQQQQ